MAATSLTDGQLVARCRRGDQEAWRLLVERFSRYVHAISIQGFRLSEHDAEDVFQDVFARAYQRLGQLRDDDAVRPWLAQLTRRACLGGGGLMGKRTAHQEISMFHMKAFGRKISIEKLVP